MLHRFASLMLILLALGFFVFHWAQRRAQPPTIAHTVFPAKQGTNDIVQDEFLILMEQDEAKTLPQVLKLFDLKLVAPLGEWAYVAKAQGEREPIALNSKKGRENQRMVAALEAHPAIHSATLNYIQSDAQCAFSCEPPQSMRMDRDDAIPVPSDPLYKFQWHLSEKQGINLPAAWRITTGHPSTIIAVVDRNFVLDGDDLTPDRCNSRHFYFENIQEYFPEQKLAGFNDSEQHGTDVLSVLAPCTNNGVGLAGIDWHAQVFAVDTRNDRSLAARMFGVMWAAGIDVCKNSLFACPEGSHFQRNSHPANIINASFGFTGPYLKEPPYGPVLDIIGWINRQGRMIVASVGNEADCADRRLPGAAGGVISVGSSNMQRQSSSFSNFGRTVDVLAPGEDILGLEKNATVSLNGTSFSSPIVAGVASLMLAVEPRLSWKQVEHILKTTASPMTCSQYCPSTMKPEAKALCEQTCCQGPQTFCAAGIIDAGRAVKMASEGLPQSALVDVDDYYLPLSDHNNMSMALNVKNWGGKKALVRQKAQHPQLKIYPQLFEVPAVSSNGEPGIREIQVYFDSIPTSELVLSLILEAASFDDPTHFNDRIEAIVEIIPDEIVAKKQYLELF